MLEQEESKGVSAADESPQSHRETPAGAPFLVELDESQSDQSATVRLVGELDLSSVETFKAAVTEGVVLDALVLVILDFEQVTFLDSSGLGALMEAKKVADEQGIQLQCINVGAAARRVFDLSGTTEHFGIE